MTTKRKIMMHLPEDVGDLNTPTLQIEDEVKNRVSCWKSAREETENAEEERVGTKLYPFLFSTTLLQKICVRVTPIRSTRCKKKWFCLQ